MVAETGIGMEPSQVDDMFAGAPRMRRIWLRRWWARFEAKRR
jgi:hypothetical protein